MICQMTSFPLLQCTLDIAGLPRYAIYCARLIVRGRETLKTGKAWDETSRAHRKTPGRARPVASTTTMYKRIHSRAFDARMVRVGVSLDCRATCSCQPEA